MEEVIDINAKPEKRKPEEKEEQEEGEEEDFEEDDDDEDHEEEVKTTKRTKKAKAMEEELDGLSEAEYKALILAKNQIIESQKKEIAKLKRDLTKEMKKAPAISSQGKQLGDAEILVMAAKVLQF